MNGDGGIHFRQNGRDAEKKIIGSLSVKTMKQKINLYEWILYTDNHASIKQIKCISTAHLFHCTGRLIACIECAMVLIFRVCDLEVA